MKKILYIGAFEFFDKNAAAVMAIANAELIKCAFNCEIEFIGIKKNDENKITNKYYNGYKIYEYPYPRKIMEWVRFITGIQHVKNIINEIGRDNLQMIIAYNYPSIALDKIRRYCKFYNIKFISQTTEWYGKSDKRFPFNLVKDIDTYLRMHHVNVWSKNILCCSSYIEKFYNIKNCNVFRLPTLVIGGNIKTNIDKSSLIKRFVFIGRPGRTKNKERLDWIIKAFSKNIKYMNNVKLSIVGINKKDFDHIYPDLVGELEKLDGVIEWYGVVDRKFALNILLNSDFSIIARQDNRVTRAGFPTKLSEAFAYSIPVITTPNSDVKEYVKNEINGYISCTCNEDDFIKSFECALKASNEKIISMKKNILKSNPLDYKNYIFNFKKYIKELK